MFVQCFSHSCQMVCQCFCPLVFQWFSYVFAHGCPMVFPIVFRCFSHGCLMVFQWFSYVSPMVFQWFSYVFAHGFLFGFLCFSYGCPMVLQFFPWFYNGFQRFLIFVPWLSHGFPMVFLCFSHGFSMGFRMVSPCFFLDCPMVGLWFAHVFFGGGWGGGGMGSNCFPMFVPKCF